MMIVMGTPRYPTRNGIAIPTQEIWLPRTQLNLEKSKNFNNHHGEWTAKRFGGSILYQVFRDMAAHQELLPLDQHDWIHFHYAEPKFPNAYEAMNEIERGYWEKEKLKIRKAGGYILRDIDLGILNQCKKDFEN